MEKKLIITSEFKYLEVLNNDSRIILCFNTPEGKTTIEVTMDRLYKTLSRSFETAEAKAELPIKTQE